MNTPRVPYNSGLIALWEFENNFNDSGPYGYTLMNSGTAFSFTSTGILPHGTVHESSPYNTDSTFFTPPGFINRIYSGSYTFETLIYLYGFEQNNPGAGNIYNILNVLAPNTKAGLQLAIYTIGDPHDTATVVVNSAGTVTQTATGIMKNDNWYNLALTYNEPTNTTNLYIDGIQRLSVNEGAVFSGVLSTRLLNFGSSPLRGFVKNFAVYNYVRTTFENYSGYLNVNVPDNTYSFQIYDNTFKPLITGSNTSLIFNSNTSTYSVLATGIINRDSAETILITKNNWVAARINNVSGIFGNDSYTLI